MSTDSILEYGFSPVPPKSLVGECARRLEQDWMLLTAGSPELGVGTMTINWGSFGFLWRQDMAMVAVRHSRHTLPFIEKTNAFSLAFFDESFRETLTYCGRVSGWKEDKIAQCGFTTLFADGTPFFAQANTVVTCRVLYTSDVVPSGFVDPGLMEAWYAHGEHKDNMHRLYMVAMQRAWRKHVG